MTAFLFDEDHPDMKAIFGPQCASYIVQALEKIPDLSAVRLLRGSLLHTRYCYELSEVTLRGEDISHSGISSTSSSHHFKPDLDHFLTIICDLAETMHASGSSMSEEELQIVLARKNIWVVVVQGLVEEHLPKAANSLRSFGPFLGWVKVDWENPIHADLFAESLFKDMFLDVNGICKQTESWDDTEDREEEKALLREYGSMYEPRLLDWEAFSRVAPCLLSITNSNDRGTLSVRRVAGKKTGHRSKVGKALAHDFDAVGNFRKFSTSRPEDGIEFLVPEAKLTKYLLNLDHPKGGGKAQFFKDSLDIIENDWRYLADQFCQAALNSEFYRLEVTEYGVMHGAQVLITGRNGRQAVVETGWKLEETGPAKFVTAYPGDESKLKTLEAFPGRVPEPSCLAPERWGRIHEMAHNFGMESGENKIPTPMVLEDWGTIWEGACGFGWVSLPDARKPFARWSIKEGIGYPSRPGVQISSKLRTQSIEKNLAYAIGYAAVLRANGIECHVGSRLD